jgi:hypothetical protein
MRLCLACWSIRHNDSLFQLNLYYVIRIALRDRLCVWAAKESSAQSALAA